MSILSVIFFHHGTNWQRCFGREKRRQNKKKTKAAGVALCLEATTAAPRRGHQRRRQRRRQSLGAALAFGRPGPEVAQPASFVAPSARRRRRRSRVRLSKCWPWPPILDPLDTLDRRFFVGFCVDFLSRCSVGDTVCLCVCVCRRVTCVVGDASRVGAAVLLLFSSEDHHHHVGSVLIVAVSPASESYRVVVTEFFFFFYSLPLAPPAHDSRTKRPLGIVFFSPASNQVRPTIRWHLRLVFLRFLPFLLLLLLLLLLFVVCRRRIPCRANCCAAYNSIFKWTLERLLLWVPSDIRCVCVCV